MLNCIVAYNYTLSRERTLRLSARCDVCLDVAMNICRVNASFGIVFAENEHVRRIMYARIGREKIIPSGRDKLFDELIYFSIIIIGFPT